MKKINLLALTTLVLFSCSDDEPIINEKPEVKITTDEAQAPIHSESFYVLNEGWFGHEEGSLTRFEQNGTAYDITYWAYAKANAGETLGTTACYGTPWAGSYYLVSKDGTHLVAADETTLKKQFSYTSGEAGSQAYSFVGIDDQEAYIGFDNGLYVYHIGTQTVGQKVEGIDKAGIMAYTQGKVFVSSPDNIYVVNPATHQVEQSLAGNVYSLTLDNHGNVIAATAENLLRINPVTLDKEEIAYPEGAKVANPWGFAWNPGSLCASLTKDFAYWTSGKSVYKTDLNSKQSEKIYTLGKSEHGKDLDFYGAGLRVDPITDELILLVKHAGWGDAGMYNYLYKLDADGKEICHFDVLSDNGEGNYWFPSMPVFADANKPQILLQKIESNQISSVAIDLKEIITDADNLFTSMIITLEAEDNAIAKTSIQDGKLMVAFTQTKGTATCTLHAISNGVKASRTIEIVNL